MNPTTLEGSRIEKRTDASLLGVNGFRINWRRHFGDLSQSPEDDDGHELCLKLSRLMMECQIHNRQSPITRMECGGEPYVTVLENGLGWLSGVKECRYPINLNRLDKIYAISFQVARF